MAGYDLTTKLAPHLDRHLILPLFEFLSGLQLYDAKDIQRAKLQILQTTKMVDFLIDEYKDLYGGIDAPTEFMAKRKETINELNYYDNLVKPIDQCLQQEEVKNMMQEIRDSRQLYDVLVKDFHFEATWIETLFKYAKLQFEVGNYESANANLHIVQVLIFNNDKLYLPALWGRLACLILMQDWELALEEVERLKENIESAAFTPLQALQQRTSLIHWGLFLFFNHTKGKDIMLDMLLYQPQYLIAIQTQCPHILRYLAAAAIINKKKRNVLKDLVKIIQQESYTFQDPITEFLECLYVRFDFDGAQQKLRECETVLKYDFFLVACVDDFIESARLFIFETFCRIHQCISINMLASKLNMMPDAAERWIVNLIRTAHMEARIDSKLGHVVMGQQAVSLYQQVFDKTKALAYRTQMLVMKLENKKESKKNNEWGTAD